MHTWGEVGWGGGGGGAPLFATDHIFYLQFVRRCKVSSGALESGCYLQSRAEREVLAAELVRSR